MSLSVNGFVIDKLKTDKSERIQRHRCLYTDICMYVHGCHIKSCSYCVRYDCYYDNCQLLLSLLLFLLLSVGSLHDICHLGK